MQAVSAQRLGRRAALVVAVAFLGQSTRAAAAQPSANANSEELEAEPDFEDWDPNEAAPDKPAGPTGEAAARRPRPRRPNGRAAPASPTAQQPAAPADKSASAPADAAGKVPARVFFPDQPLWWGISLEVLAGALASPTAGDRGRTSWDRVLGLRTGYRRTAWKGLRVGGEVTARSTFLAYDGSQPIWPLALVARAGGSLPNQSIRWLNQLSGGGLVGWRFEKMDLFVEPALTAGLGFSHRQLAVHLGRALPYNRSHVTLGPYVGAALGLGLRPLSWRMDVQVNHESGPPPFTTRVPAFVFHMGLGVAL